MTRYWVLALFAAILSVCAYLSVSSAVVGAQASSLPTEVLLDEFPEVIEFRAEAPSADTNAVSLQLRLLPAGEPVIVDANLDGDQLSAIIRTAEPTVAWTWLPVGAELEYLWIIDGEATSPAVWRYLDPRFDWGTAADGEVVVWRPGPDLQADHVAGHAVGALDLVADLLETPIEQPISLVVWPSSTAAADGIPVAIFGGQPPPLPRLTVAAGHGERLIHIFRDTTGDVRSAVSDVVMETAAHPHPDAIPLWFRVALGLWSQGPMHPFFVNRARSVVDADYEEFYSAEELDRFPSSWQYQALYLGQAGGMLSWMLQDWGPSALVELFDRISAGAAFYDALEVVFGYDRDQFIAEFTQNAERVLELTWPYIESEADPFWQTLDIGLIMAIVAAVIAIPFVAYIGYRLLQ